MISILGINYYVHCEGCPMAISLNGVFNYHQNSIFSDLWLEEMLIVFPRNTEDITKILLHEVHHFPVNPSHLK